MAASTQPIFPNAPLIGVATLSAATTGRTVTGVTGLTQVVASTTNGVRVDRVRCIQNGAIGTACSNNIIRLWLYAGSGNAMLIDEYAISAATPTATAAGAALDTTYSTLSVPAGSSLYVSIHTYAGVQDGFNVQVYGGTY